jgi:hypothetical protein
MNDDSDDSDDWATEELSFATSHVLSATKEENHRPGAWQLLSKDEVDETDWQAPIAVSPQVQNDSDPNNKSNPGESMILVDMTALTKLDTRFGTSIHCRFDAHSVNDPDSVRALRTKIEREYETFAKDTDLIASGIVIPCGTSVWRPALSRLRLEKPGHYFCTIFPSVPKKIILSTCLTVLRPLHMGTYSREPLDTNLLQSKPSVPELFDLSGSPDF